MGTMLITGGCGFVGSHLAEYLVNDGYNVTIVDDLSSGSLNNVAGIKEKLKIVNADINKFFHETIDSEKIDCIFHLATHPRSFSLNDPYRNLEVNVTGTLDMLEFARRNDCKVVFTSNTGIYGEPRYLPVDENHPDDPKTPYDANKLISEHYGKIYHQIYGIHFVAFRLATVYGERQKQNPQMGWKPVVAEFVSKVLNHGTPTIDGDGKQTRDFIYVKDVVQGLVKGFTTNTKADVFNLSTCKETSVLDLLNMIMEITRIKVIPKFGPPLPGDIRRMIFTYEKAKSSLHYEPKYSLREGLQKYISWYQKNVLRSAADGEHV